MSAAPPKPTSIAVTAATFTGNHGAEAMLLATMAGLRARLPSPAFHVYSYYPAEDRAFVRDRGVRVFSLTPLTLVTRLVPLAALYALLRRMGLHAALRAFPEDVQALAASAVQVDLAGVSFVEGRERFLPFNVLTLVPAFLLGVPVVKLSQAMGPFRPWLNRVLARATLSRCAAVFARGARSFGHLEALALPTEVRRADDLAFLLDTGVGGGGGEPDRAAKVIREITAIREGARSVVAVCPSSLLAGRHDPAYLDLLVGLIADLVSEGDRVVLLPNATRGHADAGPRNNDLHAIRRILQRLPGDARRCVVAVEGDVHAPEILRILGAVDMAVVSRFHAMVGCLSLSVPVVVVGWSHKYREVMEAFGLGAHVFDAAAVDGGGILSVLSRYREDPDGYRERIARALREVRISAGAQLDFVADRMRQ